MNALELSLEIIIVGSRGAGKTLCMTHFILETLQRVWALLKFRELYGDNGYRKHKTNVWSNYPVKAKWKPHFAKRPIHLEAKRLDIEKLITWDPEYHDGIIFFDEIDQVADRQDWYSTVAKFLTAGAQMLRHRNLSLIMSIQSLEWLNARLQWQADIIIKCRDLAFTPWGRENHLKPGEVTNTVWIDKSGIMTGYSFEERPIVYPLQFFGKRYWGAYSTTHEFNILDHKTKYKTKVPEKLIDLTGGEDIEAKNKEALEQAVLYLVYSNQDMVGRDDLTLRAMELGFEGDLRNYNNYLLTLGVKRNQKNNQVRYSLEGVKLST